MMNLYYRGYAIHEDIRAICYTISGCRPDRIELGNSVTAKEAMRWVDRHVARRAAERWIDRDVARRTNKGQTRPSQHAML